MIFNERAFLRSCLKIYFYLNVLIICFSSTCSLVAEAVQEAGAMPAPLEVKKGAGGTEELGNFAKILRSFEKEDGDYDLFKQFRLYPQPRNKFLSASKTTEVSYGGCVKTDYYGARHAKTLDKERKDDVVDQFRERAEFILQVSQKMDPYRDKPVVESRFTIGNVMFWRSYYQPDGYSVVKDQFGAMATTVPSVRANLQEAWVKVNVDQIFSNHEPVGLSIKAGYFPFIVGRGVALGDWYNGGALSFGFSKAGVQEVTPKFAPGLLASGTLYNNCLHYDLYFSPAVTEEVSTSLGGTSQTSSLIDGVSDRHLLAGKLRGYYNFYGNSKTYFEPYFVYYNSPRNSVNAPYDAPLRFLTFGCMLDHKAGGFEFNAEFAQQFGRNKVRENLNTSRPDINKFWTTDASGKRVFNSNPQPNFFRPAEEGTIDLTGFVKADGTDATDVSDAYAALPTSYPAWQDEARTSWQEQRFFEYHHPYEFDLEGRMLMIDMRYTFDDYPLQVAGAFGYFSGDVYPYNDDVDKYFVAEGETPKPSGGQAISKRHNFLPLRDYHYTGLWAFPMVNLNSGLVPRSYGVSYRSKTAISERDACTNMIFLAAGFTVSPTNDLERFRINPNVAIYWSDSDAKKWDKNALLPPLVKEEEDFELANSFILSEESAKIKNPGGLTSIKPQYTYQILQGWESNELASSTLGWEVNCLVNYFITDNLDLMIKAGVFFPGQRYRDLAGQPEASSAVPVVNINPNGTSTTILKNMGIGYDVAYGVNVRLAYSF